MPDFNQNVKGQVQKNNKKDQKKETFAENIKTLLIALLLAGIIRSFWVEPFRIPSSSMEPSLLVGDFLFVSKYTYGYSKHSFPFSLPLVKGRVLTDNPERGDVIVFRLPKNPSIHYIKRVIGLPGETVQVVGGRLLINDELVDRKLIGREGLFTTYEETLPNGKKHLIQELTDKGPADNTPLFTVPKDMVMVLGDNRDNSTDGRFAVVGFIPFENIIGKARFLFFSWQSDFPFIRFSRFFNTIQ